MSSNGNLDKFSIKEHYELLVGDKKVSVIPDFIVKKKGVAMIIIEVCMFDLWQIHVFSTQTSFFLSINTDAFRRAKKSGLKLLEQNLVY